MREARRSGAVIALVFLAALAVRVAVCRFEIYHPDSCSYLWLSQQIEGGDFFVRYGEEVEYYQPFYPFLISLAVPDGRDRILGGVIISLLAGAGAAAVAAWMAGRVTCAGDSRQKLTAMAVAGALVAVHPLAVRYSGVVLTESLFSFLFVLLAALTWAWRDRNGKWPFLVIGALAGLGYLTRAVGLLGLPVAVLWAWLGRRGGEGGRGAALRAGAFLVLGFLVISLPYIAYVRVNLGSWRVTGQEELFLGKIADNVWEDEEQYDFALTPDGRRFATEEHGLEAGIFATMWGHRAFMKRLVNGNLENMVRVIAPGLHLAVLLPFILAGLAGGKRREAAYIVSWWLPFLVVYGVTFSALRYFVPLLPLLLVTAAAGTVNAGRWICARPARNGRVVPGIAVSAVIACALCGFLLHRVPRERHAEAVRVAPLREMGLRLSGSVREGTRIMDRKPFVPYFAGGEFVGMPYDSVERILGYARHVGVEYLVVDSDIVAAYRPMLSGLLEGSETVSGLMPVMTKELEGRKIVIYRVEYDGGT